MMMRMVLGWGERKTNANGNALDSRLYSGGVQMEVGVVVSQANKR